MDNKKLMNLERATLLASIVNVFLFILTIVMYLYPPIFDALIFHIVILIPPVYFRDIITICFFVFFYKEYIRKEQVLLKVATLLLIYSSSIMLLSNLGNEQSLIRIILQILSLTLFDNIAILVEYLINIFIMIFFFSFHRVISKQEQPVLRRAVLIAMIGSIIPIINKVPLFLDSLVWFLEDIISLDPGWGDFTMELMIAYNRLPTFVEILKHSMFFALLAYFFWVFYKELRKRN